jgi:phage baseplate assembly protein W
MSAADDPGKEFLGRGWAFPFRILPGAGQVESVCYEADIKQAVEIILGTAKGERVMRPDFGCGIHDLVFSAIDAATLTRIKQEVLTALRTYEARIDVLAVDIDRAPLLDGRLDVSIHYRVRTTNQSDNYVYPFYFREAR